MGDISIKGKSPILRQSFAIGGAVKRLARGLKGRQGRGKDFKTHGKDVPTMAAKGGRIGLKKGSVHKPGSYSYFLQEIHKPRKSKALGGGIKHITDKLRPGVFKPKKKVYPETEDLTHQVGPYAGDVGSEGKRRRAGPKAGRGWGKRPQGRSPGRPKAGPKAPTGRPKAGPKAGPKAPTREQGPGGRNIVPDPRRKYPTRERNIVPDPRRTPGEKKEYQPAATGGRIGLKKGGSDKKWIQKAVNPKHKGYCTPMTKKTCTPARKALARTFKKKAKTGW